MSWAIFEGQLSICRKFDPILTKNYAFGLVFIVVYGEK